MTKAPTEDWVKDRVVFSETTPDAVRATFTNWQAENADRVRRIVLQRIKQGWSKPHRREFSMVVDFDRRATPSE